MTEDMARRGDAPEKGHFTLKRPHSIMCVATVAGGSAERGLLIKHLAKRLCESDGCTKFDVMLSEAVENLGLVDTNQVPDIRKTLMKRLILPPTHHNRNQDIMVEKVPYQIILSFYTHIIINYGSVN